MPRSRLLSLPERDRVIRDAVATLPGPVAQRFLEVIMSPPEERAAFIGRLYAEPDGEHLAELLIDLAEDRQLALDPAQALKHGVTGRYAPR